MISYKKNGDKNTILLNEEKSVPYFYFPILEKTGKVKHGFSTRIGGVSEGEFSTMNFNLSRGDKPENVEENYKRFCKAIECDWDKAIMTHQTHTVNVRTITKDMITKGRSLFEKKPFTDVDGFITNVPEVVLITSYADCVPLYFLDPVKNVIGLSHSGWRGTVMRMGKVTVEKMNKEFGCRPEDILACIGPSICKNCYEIGVEVAEEFKKSFAKEKESLILEKTDDDHYHLDLWRANEIILLEAGLKSENIAVTEVCTCCNPELLFSHRFTNGKRGNLCAFLSLK